MEFVDLPPDSSHWEEALPVLAELRPRLTPSVLEEVLREAVPQGLRFLGAFDGDQCMAVAGWRVVTNTSVGRKFYVDDLVTAKNSRSQGVGASLLKELERRALDEGCVVVELDSGVQRYEAHRFYLREHMAIKAHHFSFAVTHMPASDTGRGHPR